MNTTQNDNGRPSVDQMIWMGIGSNPGKMLAWSAIGSAAVMLILAKVFSDTVKYYDHHGFRTNIQIAILIACGTLMAFVHGGIVCAQTFQLSRFAYPSYASIAVFDNYANTTSNLIGGLFNFAAAIYYTNQIMRADDSVAILGYWIPRPEMGTMGRYRALNIGRVPYFKAWGVFALLGDASIFLSMTYYLFRIKDSVMHKQRKVVYKLQTLILGTMLPPVVMTLILAISQKSGTSNIGDYRRVVKYVLPVLYYLSPLHSTVTHIDIQARIRDRDDDTSHPDSKPLSPRESQWPTGQQSTIHIDPMRGKWVDSRNMESGETVSVVEGIPCKRTFGAEESIPSSTHTVQSAANVDSEWSQRSSGRNGVRTKDMFYNGGEQPSKRTFGVADVVEHAAKGSVVQYGQDGQYPAGHIPLAPENDSYIRMK